MSAEAGLDFDTATLLLEFPAGDGDGIMRCVNPVVDDAALESDETFSVTLTLTTGNASIGINETFITIVDNDSKPLYTGYGVINTY